MDTFEYKIVAISRTSMDSTLDAINALGADGWELVLVVADRHAVFKRKVVTQPAGAEFGQVP